MPTYEYECGRCEHAFERFQSMTDEPLKRCPKCKGKVRRVIGTGAGLLFKGSGFYITDYRNDSYTQASKAEKSASSGADEAAKKPSEKPAATEKVAKTPTPKGT